MTASDNKTVHDVLGASVQRLFYRPDAPLTLRRMTFTFVCAALAVILVDPLVGLLLKAYFPETPNLLTDNMGSIGLDAFWQMAEQGKRPIVFTGSSTTFFGISPHDFDADVQQLNNVGVLSVNVAVTSQTAIMARDLIRDVILPRTPGAIVYGVELRSFAHMDGDIQMNYPESPLGWVMQQPESTTKSLALWLYEHSWLVQYRRNFSEILQMHRTVWPGFGIYNVIDDRGHALYDGLQDPNGTMPVPNAWTPLRIESAYQDALVEIAEMCRQQATRCVVLVMPVHMTLYRVLTTDDLSKFHAFLQSALENTGVSIWDFNNPACINFLGDAFQDHDHMNRGGAQRFTQMLAILYANQFMGTPIPAGSGVDCVARS